MIRFGGSDLNAALIFRVSLTAQQLLWLLMDATDSLRFLIYKMEAAILLHFLKTKEREVLATGTVLLNFSSKLWMHCSSKSSLDMFLQENTKAYLDSLFSFLSKEKGQSICTL